MLHFLLSLTAGFLALVYSIKAGAGFVLGTLLLLLAGAATFLALYRLRPACPKCQSRLGRRWRYERVDGGPDRRYQDNQLVCVDCHQPWPVGTRYKG